MFQKVETNIEYLTRDSRKWVEKGFICMVFSGIKIASSYSGRPVCRGGSKKTLRNVIPILALLLISLAVFGCGDEGVVDAVFTEDDPQPPDELQGSAYLENMSEHSAIRIEMKEIDLSLITDAEGNYSLPNEMAEGEWTLRASYPYFTAAEQSFTIINGMPESDLEPMELAQEVVFNVVPDKPFYTYGETVIITLNVHNVVDYPVTLSSQTSPMTAFAVRHEGATVVGGLFPGQGSEPQSVTIEPGEFVTFVMNWTIDNPDLDPGEYEIYSIVANSDSHPDYFSFDSELADELNKSLFAKLVPATISISAN